MRPQQMRPQLKFMFPLMAIVALASHMPQTATAQLFRSRSSCYCPQQMRVQPTCQSAYNYAPAVAPNYQVMPQNLHVPNTVMPATAQPIMPALEQPITLNTPTTDASNVVVSIPTVVDSVVSSPSDIVVPPTATVLDQQSSQIAPATFNAPIEAAAGTVAGSPVAPASAIEVIAPVATGDAQITPEPAVPSEQSILKK